MAKRRKRPWRTQEKTSVLKQIDTVGAKTDKSSPDKNIPSCRAVFSRRTEKSALLPRWTPWLVTLMTFAIRVHHVIEPTNWWVLHPDEIYQSMEVAHSELYGYGHRPYEFIPPHKGDNLSHYQLRERSLGMNAIRSPIMPQYMVLVTWFAHTAGLDVSNPYLVFRLSHIAITSLLPLAVFRFAHVTCRCPDVASVAAILTGSSAYLSTLGSHTLINSFVSPAIFFGLAKAVRLLRDIHKTPVGSPQKRDENLDLVFSNDNEVQREIFSAKDNITYQKSGKYDSFRCYHNNSLHKLALVAECEGGFERDKNSIERLRSRSVQKLSSSTDQDADKIAAMGDNLVVKSNTQYLNMDVCTLSYRSALEDQGYVSRAGSSRTSSSSNESASTIHDESGHESDCSLHCYDNNEQTNLPTEERSKALRASKNLSHLESSPEKGESQNQYMLSISHIITGIMLSVAMYVRPDTTLLVSLVLLGNHKLGGTLSLLRSWRAWQLVFGGVIGLILAAINDAIFYDCLVFSPINWARLNVFNGMASKLFGVSKWNFYLLRVFLGDFSMCVASSVLIVAALIYIYQLVISSTPRIIGAKHSKPIDADSNRKALWFPEKSTCENKSIRGTISCKGSVKVHIVCVVILTTIYSCMGHKEERFLHDTVVLFLIVVSQTLLKLVDFLVRKVFKISQCNRKIHTQHDNIDQSANHSERQSTRLFLILLVLFVFVTNQIRSFTAPFEIQRKQWHNTSRSSDLDTTMCMRFLSQRADVSGLFVDRNIKHTGGYSVLHKNVPLFYLLGNDFIEFTNSSLVTEKRACVIGSLGDTRARIISREANVKRTINSSQVNNYVNRRSRDIDSLSDDLLKDATIDEIYRDSDNNPCEVGYYSINMISDLIHKDNNLGLLRKIVGALRMTRPDHSDTNKHHFHQRQSFSKEQQQQQQRPHQQQQQQHHSRREIPRYNYAIVQADKPFLSPAFRPVYRTATMWVWRRVNTPQTEARLRATFQHIQAQSESIDGEKRKADNNVSQDMDAHRPEGVRTQSESFHINSKAVVKQNMSQHLKVSVKPDNSKTTNSSDTNDIPTSVAMMEYEGEILKQLGNYWAALARFEAIALAFRSHDLQGKVKVSVLAAIVFCLHRLGEQQKMQSVLGECVMSHPRDLCLGGWRPTVPKLASKLREG